MLFPRSKTSTKRETSVPSSPSNNPAHISMKPSPSETVNSDWEKPTVTPVRIINTVLVDAGSKYNYNFVAQKQ